MVKKQFYQGSDFVEKYIAVVLDKGVDFGIKFIIAILVLVIGIKISKWLTKKIFKLQSLTSLEEGVRNFLSYCIKFLLYTVVIISAAGIIGIPYASFVALLGSAGLAVGLAAQGSLSNVSSGVLILINKPFKIGDLIEVNSTMGTVSEIGFFTTSLVTADNKVISYPNSSITNTYIINHTKNKNRMINLSVGIGYDSDIDDVRSIVSQIASEDIRIMETPKPFVGVSSFGESALIVTIRIWCKSEDYWDLFFSFNENLKKAFDENNIEIPYNKLDVNILKDGH